MVCCERGLLWTWSVTNMVCYEHSLLCTGLLWTGLLWAWSVMNMVCYERVCYECGLLWVWSVMNVVYYELVFYESGPWWMGLLGLWSVLNASFMNVVCYEQDSYERGRLLKCCKHGLLWTCFVTNKFRNELLWKWSVMNMVCYEHGLLWTGLLWTWSLMNMVCYERGLQWMWSVMNENGGGPFLVGDPGSAPPLIRSCTGCI